MRIELFEFQKDALHLMRDKVNDARRSASPRTPKAIILSAPTGSGKTVMMTALFEAILDQPDDQLDWPAEWQPQPDAVILWVSDMPDLNLQTKLKIERQSDKVYRVGQLEVITSDFDAERLTGGRIYFINTQKLATDKKLVSVGDGRAYSIWTTLSNTARAIPDRFYVVIDEAHRGMGSARGANNEQTIVQHLIKGNPDLGVVKMPMLIGVTATPARFQQRLTDASHDQLRVAVPVDEVRKSGLIKDRVRIHYPLEGTNAEIGVLEEAARQWQVMCDRWRDYCAQEALPVVRPIFLIQIEDGEPTRTKLVDVLAAIEASIGRSLRDEELAHALQDKGNLSVGGRTITYMEPSRIEENPDISVVFFKMALTTGWDCPRAEVMMSFRGGQDHTYIAQLLGRMVRTPLAGRIEGHADLNDVHVYLPHFNKDAVEKVVSTLHSGEDIPPTEVGDARKLITLKRRPGTEEIFRAMEEDGLITYRVNAVRAQSDIYRYQAMASRLTRDNIAPDAWEEAKLNAVKWMAEQVAQLKDAGEFEQARRRISQVGIKTLSVSVDGMAEEGEDYLIDASHVDIDRQFDDASRILGKSHALPLLYRKANTDRDDGEVVLEAIIVAFSHSARAALERKSKAEFNQLYQRYLPSIGRLPDAKKAEYKRLKSATEVPEAMQWELHQTIDFSREPADPEWNEHLYVEDDGRFRTSLGTWEAGVLAIEQDRPDFRAWLRNVDRKRWSLEIPYQVDGDWRPMFPDLLIVRQVGSGFEYDILEPHDGSLGDSIPKAQGLARFAEKHGDLFRRVQLIRKLGDAFVRLEMTKVEIQDRIKQIGTNAALDALFDELGII